MEKNVFLWKADTNKVSPKMQTKWILLLFVTQNCSIPEVWCLYVWLICRSLICSSWNKQQKRPILKIVKYKNENVSKIFRNSQAQKLKPTLKNTHNSQTKTVCSLESNFKEMWVSFPVHWDSKDAIERLILFFKVIC